MLAQLQAQNTKVYDAEVAIVLRAIEDGARNMRRALGGDSAYLALVGRLLRQTPTQTPPPVASSLIIT